MKLMIVESPNKTKKIVAELGKEWKVIASAGHVRDLPKETKHCEGSSPLDRIGIDGKDFSLRYEFVSPISSNGHTYPGGEERVARIKNAANGASAVYLATDPDREGEAIAWHLKEALGLADDGYKRVTFHEISGNAIHEALANVRKIDLNLVHAQEARRALDRMVGYLVSPVLSELLGKSVSAGRVQSVAARLLVDQERRIKAFKVTKYFGASVTFDAEGWQAEWNTKPFISEQSSYMLDESLARTAAACRTFRVLESQTETTREAPPKPFSTALMLRAASVALSLDPEVAAKLAQRLFEQGAITYIRTDSVNFATKAIEEIRSFASMRGLSLPEEARKFKGRAGAQEAHEAIRPSHIEVEAAGETDDERALYSLIWRRTVASQLSDAVYKSNTVLLESTDGDQVFEFNAKGRVVIERGWRALTLSDAANEGEVEEEMVGRAVPVLSVGTIKLADGGTVVAKHSIAPRRYTKASLIEKLETEGIGRPSTYPTIMATIVSRGYAVEEKPYLIPTETGEQVVDNLIKAGFGFIDIAFTRHLEDRLDAIAEGRAGYQEVLRPAYTQLHEELQHISRIGSMTAHRAGPGYATEPPADDKGGHSAALKQHHCPKCQSLLRRFEHKNKKTGKASGFAWVCTDAACNVFLDDEKGNPVERLIASCPTCGRPMVRRKNTNGVGHWWGCSGYREGCTLTMDDRDGTPVPHGSSNDHDKENLRSSATRARFAPRKRR
jgi:DNA topoisomerase-1